MNRTVSDNSAFEQLFARINYERQAKVAPGDFKLSNMVRFLEQLGNPHFACPVIHVAGTKGKGSVSAFISSILNNADYRTGVYSSPHLERVNQRIQVAGCEISDEDLQAVLQKMQPVIEMMDVKADRSQSKKLTFFEVITAAAFQHFSDLNLDAVVLEVGMGGRLDSTNVCQPDVCVITNISLDHTRQLGSTLELIAAEKAGIIKPGVPVVSGVQDKGPKSVIHQIANENRSNVYQIGDDFSIDHCEPDERRFNYSSNAGSGLSENGRKIESLVSGMYGSHQQINAAIAIAACEQLIEKSWEIDDKAIRSGTQAASLPGRCEVVSREPLVVLDIAHNEASMAALAHTLNSEIPEFRSSPNRTLIFAASKEKDVEAMLRPLIPCFDKIILTQFQNNPRARAVNELAEISNDLVKTAGHPVDLIQIGSPIEAIRQVLKYVCPGDTICITGSAFLVAELRSIALNTWNNR